MLIVSRCSVLLVNALRSAAGSYGDSGDICPLRKINLIPIRGQIMPTRCNSVGLSPLDLKMFHRAWALCDAMNTYAVSASLYTFLFERCPKHDSATQYAFCILNKKSINIQKTTTAGVLVQQRYKSRVFLLRQIWIVKYYVIYSVK